MEVDKSKGYWFAVGSFMFRDFKELHDNIKGRTGSFTKYCSVVKDGKGLFNFKLKYEYARPGFGGQEQFVIELDHATLSAFNGDADMVKALGQHMPGFKRIGCTAKGSVAEEKFYGYIDIKKLG